MGPGPPDPLVQEPLHACPEQLLSSHVRSQAQGPLRLQAPQVALAHLLLWLESSSPLPSRHPRGGNSVLTKLQGVLLCELASVLPGEAAGMFQPDLHPRRAPRPSQHWEMLPSSQMPHIFVGSAETLRKGTLRRREGAGVVRTQHPSAGI